MISTHAIPTHFEDKFVSPDISTVGYIKLPQSMSEYKHTKPHHSVGGYIEFMEGTEDMFTNATYLLQPKLMTFISFQLLCVMQYIHSIQTNEMKEYHLVLMQR